MVSATKQGWGLLRPSPICLCFKCSFIGTILEIDSESELHLAWAVQSTTDGSKSTPIIRFTVGIPKTVSVECVEQFHSDESINPLGNGYSLGQSPIFLVPWKASVVPLEVRLVTKTIWG